MRFPLGRAGLFGVFAIVIPLLISGCDNPSKGGYGAGQSSLPGSQRTNSIAAGTHSPSGCFADALQLDQPQAAAKSALRGETDGR